MTREVFAAFVIGLLSRDVVKTHNVPPSGHALHLAPQPVARPRSHVRSVRVLATRERRPVRARSGQRCSF